MNIDRSVAGRRAPARRMHRVWTNSTMRRTVAVFAFLALTATESDAFKVNYHVEITQDALVLVPRQLPQSVADALRVRGVSVRTFTTDAAKEIVDANKARDLNHCGNEFDSTPARPCTADDFGGEELAALVFLEYEAAEDHFDAETIELGSNKLFAARRDIREALKRGDFIRARKVLGGALHSLQDFYAHSNFVELGLPGIEDRLGKSVNAFSNSNGRRIAAKDEPMCVEGERLLTQLTAAQQNELIARYARAAQQGTDTGAITADVIRKVIVDRPLTTGYFYLFYPELPNLTVETVLRILRDATLTPSGDLTFPNSGDPPIITDAGKCRHGWRASYKHWSGAELVYKQAGINKDEPEFNANGFRVARQRALDHSVRFILDVMGDPELKGGPVSPVDAALGLMGYEPTPMIHSFKLGIPGAPNGDSWDTAIGGILTFNLKGIQPDISVCVESERVPGTCAQVCEDADWSNELNAYVCERTLGAQGLGVLADRNLRFLVREVDTATAVTVATFRVEDPRRCDPFCSLELEPGRTVWVQFDLKPAVAGYTDPRRTNIVNLPPPEAFPIAKPGADGGSAPAPTSPSSSTSDSGSNTTSTTDNSPSPSSRTASPLPRTPEGLDAALNLRDLDNCLGSDMFYPSTAAATLTQQLGARGSQLYQMAAFAMAISDPAAKQAVLSAIQTKVGDDAFFTAMTTVIADPVQAQALSTAYQKTAGHVAQQIVSSGLTALMLTPKPLSALAPDVDRWIASKLSSPALAAGAVDMMSAGARPLTAECTLNELAKQGFTLAVLGQ